jgi:MFS family permease
MQGTFFVISVFIQTVRGYSAVETGLILSPATIGILLSSAMAGRLAQKRSQRALIRAGFVVTLTGTALTLVLNSATSHILYFAPGLFLMGAGIGVMLTSSVNVVQSSFPEKDQGEISGLSRSVSNLGSSIGVALVGSVLVSASSIGNEAFAYAMITMIGIGILGLVAALLLPPDSEKAGEGDVGTVVGTV